MNVLKKAAVTASVSALVLGSAIVTADQAVAKDSKWTEKTKVSLDSEQAKLGYTIGAQIGANLVGQGMDKRLDIVALTAAIRDAAAGIEPRLTQEQMQEAQMAFQQALQAEQEKEQAAMVEKGKANIAAGEAFMAQNAKDKGVKTTESGLQYNIVREGKGESPAAEDTVKVHYTGKLIDGTEFDSSYTRGQPASFAVGAVIPGFSEGLQLMKEGGKIRLVIPENLAYGLNAPATIGPNQVLIFEVELLEVTSGAGEKKQG